MIRKSDKNNIFQNLTLLKPLFWNQIIYGNRKFILKESIRIEVDFKDGLWIHEYEPLGIIAYDETRSESLNMFRMDFAFCWDNIAQDKDKNLALDAQELKKKLLELVDRVEKL